MPGDTNSRAGLNKHFLVHLFNTLLHSGVGSGNPSSSSNPGELSPLYGPYSINDVASDLAKNAAFCCLVPGIFLACSISTVVEFEGCTLLLLDEISLCFKEGMDCSSTCRFPLTITVPRQIYATIKISRFMEQVYTQLIGDAQTNN